MVTTILKKKYDYQPDESILDWDTAPDPPANYRCCLQWDHDEFDKSYNNHVLTRLVREAFAECLGGFPHFAAPELLDEQGFRKFCFLAEENESYCLDEPPRNYLPHDFRDKPEEWEQKQFLIEENIQSYSSKMPGLMGFLNEDDDNDQSDDCNKKPKSTLFRDVNGNIVSSRDEVVLMGLSNQDFNGKIGTALNIDPKDTGRIAVRIPDLRGDKSISIKAINLRKNMTNDNNKVSTNSTPKEEKPPAENLKYDFVYFSISNAYDETWHGVAHTTNDMMSAVTSKEKDWGENSDDDEGRITLTVDFIKFNRKQAIVPLLQFESSQYYECPEKAILDGEYGKRYFGVEYAGIRSGEYTIWPKYLYTEHPDEEFAEYISDGGDHIKLLEDLKYYEDFKPRNPRINLLDMGVITKACCRCGSNDCCMCRQRSEDDYNFGSNGNQIIYCSPQWFKNDKKLLASPDGNGVEKNVVVFYQSTNLFDKC